MITQEDIDAVEADLDQREEERVLDRIVALTHGKEHFDGPVIYKSAARRLAMIEKELR